MCAVFRGWIGDALNPKPRREYMDNLSVMGWMFSLRERASGEGRSSEGYLIGWQDYAPCLGPYHSTAPEMESTRAQKWESQF